MEDGKKAVAKKTVTAAFQYHLNSTLSCMRKKWRGLRRGLRRELIAPQN
jgi:hypothetical protein